MFRVWARIEIRQRSALHGRVTMDVVLSVSLRKGEQGAGIHLIRKAATPSACAAWTVLFEAFRVNKGDRVDYGTRGRHHRSEPRSWRRR
jgi:hypothetical protein